MPRQRAKIQEQRPQRKNLRQQHFAQKIVRCLGVLCAAAPKQSRPNPLRERQIRRPRPRLKRIRPAKYTVDGGGMGMREVFRGALWRPTLRG
jgi:hypothetical protein